MDSEETSSRHDLDTFSMHMGGNAQPSTYALNKAADRSIDIDKYLMV